MSASLVGSEMCIRDSLLTHRNTCRPRARARALGLEGRSSGTLANPGPYLCLLYTSDAADDM
eukprot:3028443-Alexandrium_andersonii.AAC.1